jgi:hypothetical protein
MKQPPALAIACLIALSACDAPSAPPPPNPAGTWEFRMQAEPPYTYWRYDLRSDGTFERTEGALTSTREEMVTEKIAGSWRVDTAQLEQPAWWQRFWPWASKPPLSSPNRITLSYWVPARSNLAVGAVVMEKRHIGPILEGKEQWRIEERHVLTLRGGQGDANLSIGRQTFRKIK